jgi:Tfp pilus assembly protein PilF
MSQKFTDYYESNLKLLKQNHPDVWQQILEEPPEPLGTIFYTANDQPNLTVTNPKGELLTLHNENCPEKDSKDFLNRIPKDHKGFVSILGMGLGYGVLEILKERPLLQYLAIFELEPGIFIQALRYTDLSPLLEDSRFILCLGQDIKFSKDLVSASRTLQLEDANIFNHFPSFKFNPTGYKKLKDELYSHINSLNVGGTTTRALGKDFLKNRFKHISTIQHHLLLEQIQYKFNNTPAILVAGGPSLDKNVHLLKQVQEKSVIFAVDTVLPTLIKHGVSPHFLTSIDPKNLTYEKFADVIPKVKDISLICSSWVNLRTAKVFPASQIFWTFTANPLEAWLNSLLGGKVLTGGASTVAHLNLIAAHMLGCDPIIFIGQDLAYPSAATHAKGTVLHGSAPTGITVNDMGQTVKGIDGTLLRTDRSFLSMKTHFESAIAKSPQTYINATEGGAHIEGTKVLSLQETINQHCSISVEATRRIKEYASDAGPINTKEMLLSFIQKTGKITELKKIVKKSDKITNSLLKELTKKSKKKSVRSFANLSQQHQKQIAKIDNFHKNLDSALEIWKILEEITMDGLKESERQRQEISTLENNPKEYSQWLTKNLQRLLDINIIRLESLTLLENNLNMVISFNEKENQYLDQTKKENNLKLIRLYMNSGNFFLAKPLVENLLQGMPESGELLFYLGCISGQSNEHEKSVQYFNRALEIEPNLSEKIAFFQENLGDEFMEFTRYFKTQPGREASIKYTVFKGLRHCPKHDALKRELERILKEELKTIRDYLNLKNYGDAKPLITDWNKKISEQNHLAQIIPPVYMSQIFENNGKLLLKEKKYSDALANFQNAIKLSPFNDELHFIIIDTYFVTKDFNGAIEAITKAIGIDKKFAAYWETIGDSLRDGDQYEDAILAYERCFTYIPENINLLKKIGDCYMATDQLDAAKASFEQLILKMEKHNKP